MWSWSEEDLAALTAFLIREGIGTGPVRASLLGNGLANLTFLVTDGAREVVVRRPPPPPIPVGANDVVREARVMAALAGTEVPVPEVLAVAEAGDVLDVPLVVTAYVPGTVVTTAMPTALDDESGRQSIGLALVDTLAAVHAIDWRAQGLDGLGRPEGFNSRQVRRLGSLVADSEGSLPPAFRSVGAWLEAGAPPEAGATLVHGDYRLGNVMLADDPPARIAAVLDWEMATLGDPLHDLGWLLASYPEVGEEHTPMQDLGTAQLEPGFPTRRELAHRYAAASGRSLEHLRWYVVMANWKMAILFEHSRRRALEGVGDPYYAVPTHVPRFLEAAQRSLDEVPLAALGAEG